MIETFHEENVVDANPKKAKGKSAVYNVMKYIFLVTGIVFALIVFILFNNPIGEEGSMTATWILIGLFALWSVLSFGFFFFFRSNRISSGGSYD